MKRLYKIMQDEKEVKKTESFKEVLDYIQKNKDFSIKIEKVTIEEIEYNIFPFFKNNKEDTEKRKSALGYKLKTDFLKEDRKLPTPFELLLGISYLGELACKHQKKGLNEKEILVCTAHGLKNSYLSNIELENC